MVGDSMAGGFLQTTPQTMQHVLRSKFLTNWAIGRHAARTLAAGGSLTYTSGTGGRPHEISATYVANLAISALVQGLAHEMAPRQRVNAVAPTFMGTGTAFWRHIPPAELGGQQAAFAASVPLRRVATTAEVAAAYLHLMTNTFTTGQVLAVDGGVMLAPGPHTRGSRAQADLPDAHLTRRICRRRPPKSQSVTRFLAPRRAEPCRIGRDCSRTDSCGALGAECLIMCAGLRTRLYLSQAMNVLGSRSGFAGECAGAVVGLGGAGGGGRRGAAGGGGADRGEYSGTGPRAAPVGCVEAGDGGLDARWQVPGVVVEHLRQAVPWVQDAVRHGPPHPDVVACLVQPAVGFPSEPRLRHLPVSISAHQPRKAHSLTCSPVTAYVACSSPRGGGPAAGCPVSGSPAGRVLGT